MKTKNKKERKVLHMAPDGFTVLDQHGNVDGFFGIVKKRKKTTTRSKP